MGEIEFYLSVLEDGTPLIFTSDVYKLEELDIINLIKLCLVERRSVSIGRKILEVYRESTKHRKIITNRHLNRIGVIEDGERNPTRAKHSNFK
jgi:hypothetical protein